MTDGQNNDKADVVSKVEFDKAVERARTLEASFVDAQKKLESYKGIDPNEFYALKDVVKTFEQKEAQGDPKKIEDLLKKAETEVANRFKNKLDEAEEKANKLANELKTLRVTEVALQKASSVFIPESLEWVKRAVNDTCDYVDGNIVVKGQDGKPVYSKENPASLMGLDEFLKDFANKNPYMVANKQLGGSRRENETLNTSGGSALTADQQKQRDIELVRTGLVGAMPK